MTDSRGVILVHSSPRALSPHIEWAAGRAIGSAASFDWQPQRVQPGLLRAEFAWQGRAGTGAAIASALHGWDHVRFEVTEDPSADTDGARWMHTPDLGIFHAQTDRLGNIVIPEDRVRAAMELGREQPFEMARGLALALGQAWDDELEPFRQSSEQNPVVWLHQVG